MTGICPATWDEWVGFLDASKICESHPWRNESRIQNSLNSLYRIYRDWSANRRAYETTLHLRLWNGGLVGFSQSTEAVKRATCLSFKVGACTSRRDMDWIGLYQMEQAYKIRNINRA